uniref:Uncharacterized protein n=1 Tax=Roseihalotalea indica TaxID=2867963 RepID=A0AA49JJF8_9BACT|nr:hypothetical protein K4G66_13780 [Tunicatimonas sp. TK19036]
MELFTSTQIFDVKTLLLLRLEVKKLLSAQEGYPIKKLDSVYLKALSERIVKVARSVGINSVSERALRLYLVDKVTDEVVLPRIKSSKSVVDLICMYLGHHGLAEYQRAKFSEIEQT